MECSHLFLDHVEERGVVDMIGMPWRIASSISTFVALLSS